MITRINGYPISAGFGDIDSVHKIPHKGVDIAVPIGTPLHAISDATVTRVNDSGALGFGKSVRMKTEDGTEIIYGHLSRVTAQHGDHVSAGDIVALSGNTGHSTGPHVHVQIVSDSGALIDPTPVAQLAAEPSGIMDHVRGFADWFVGKERDIIAGPVRSTLSAFLHDLIAVLNINSAEIITLAIVSCAGGMMISPIIGDRGKWMGRLFIAFWGGIIWRVTT
ncbi:M23 family metallopeptidase [Paenibacillus sp. P22]|uniref:M23 family metallopeptidase n=1 Tax=Paenibacillus sp. P22 TaxID=483908 RepID=UPI0004130932|nr:M23 family metallopeptidase [Paenibacillus sp. P22]